MLATSLGSFNVADFIILGILLIFLIVGLAKGFLEQVIGFVSLVVSFLLAYFFCDNLNAFICEKTALDVTMSGWFGGLVKVEQVSVTVDQLSDAVSKLTLPDFIKNAILEYSATLSENVINLAEVASMTVARYIITGVCFIAIYLVSKLVCLLFKLILRFLVEKTPLAIVDRLLGLALGVFKGVILVFFCLFLIDVLPFSFLGDVRATIDGSTLGNFLNEHNLLVMLIEKINVFLK